MKVVDIKDKFYREYDLRGIVGDDLTADVSYTFGLGFGSFVQDKKFKKVLVGYDNRLSSKYLESKLVEGLLKSGVNVVSLGLVTTPMLNCARKVLNMDASIMVTASHNPKEYNGFKVSYDKYGQAYGEKIIEVKNYIENKQFKKGHGKLTNYDIREEYLKKVKESIDIGKRLKVVVDCGNGTASIIAQDMFSMFNIDFIPLYCDSDGNFPNHHPDPNVEEYMHDLEAKVKETGSDLGIGIDGDGDRVAIIDNEGNYMTTDYQLILMCRYLKPEKLLFDVKTSKILNEELSKMNIEPIIYKTGAPILNTKMQKDHLTFGGEYSGHLYYRDKWYGFDDGLYNGLRFIEMLSFSSKSITEMLQGIKKYPSHYFNYPVSEEVKFDLVDKVKKYVKEKGYPFTDIDGVRIDNNDSMVLVRASNTGPNLTLRFEADTEEKMNSLEKEFVGLLDNLTKDL